MHFVKEWLLVISMSCGVATYLIYHAIPSPQLHSAGPALLSFARTAQPILLFIMLFLNFVKVAPDQMKPHRWQFKGIVFQCAAFLIPALTVIIALHSHGPVAEWILAHRIPFEAAMICFITPTAGAAGVVTDRLGGSVAEVVTYTILINIVSATMFPAVIPLLYPGSGISFTAAFAKILAKVFPLLIIPCLLALFLRFFLPKIHAVMLKISHWSFTIWGFSLSLAIAMCTRSIVLSGRGFWLLALICLIAFACCFIQFYVGKRLGGAGSRLPAGQAMGQKNTVLAIWLGYTFMDPVLSVVGGFYSLAHNIFNSWQLARKDKGKSF